MYFGLRHKGGMKMKNAISYFKSAESQAKSHTLEVRQTQNIFYFLFFINFFELDLHNM